MKTFARLAAVLVAAAAPAASAAAPTTPIAFVWPSSVAVEPDGSLLVVENGLHRLIRVSPAGRVTQIAELTKPYAVRRARSGIVYVTDGPVLRRVAGTRPPVKVAAADADIGPIAIARNGDVYFTTETALWRLRGGRGAPVQLAARTRFSGPHGLAVAKDGTVLVSDTGNHRILRVDPATGRVGLFGRFAEPRGLAVAADGTVYAVEASSKRVLHLSAAGRRLGFAGPAFGDPYDLALAPGGVIYVVDTAQSGYVRRVALDGKVTTVSGS